MMGRRASGSGLLVWCAACAALVLAGCAGSVPSKPEVAGMKRVWQSAEPTPGWVNHVPEAEDGMMFFVGSSKFSATDQETRDSAMAHARRQVSHYVSSLVQDKVKIDKKSQYLSSQGSDPQSDELKSMEVGTKNLLSKVKGVDFYEEQWLFPDVGIRMKSYALARVPEQDLDDAVESILAEAERQRR